MEGYTDLHSEWLITAESKSPSKQFITMKSFEEPEEHFIKLTMERLKSVKVEEWMCTVETCLLLVPSKHYWYRYNSNFFIITGREI